MDFTDKIVLLVSCLAVYLCAPGLEAKVVPVLAAVILTSFLSWFDSQKLRAALIAAFFVLCMVLPGLIVFAPLICYDALLEKYQVLCLMVLVPFVSFAKVSQPLEIAAVVLLASFCFLLKYRTTEHVRMKVDYKQMRDTTKEMTIQLKKQNSDLLEKQDYEIHIATLNERNRIAREIHDNVGHLLSSSILQIAALLAVNKDEKAKAGLSAVNETLSQAMDRIRISVHDLYDESVDLYAQIQNMVLKFTFCDLNFDYDIKSDPSKKQKYAFISIANEALCNIIKHSNARRAAIVFREHPALYQLIISDDGTVKNFNMDNGIGLKNITDRVQSLKGNINITADNGFKIFISVPKEK